MTLYKEKVFIKLLINTTSEQARALLYTITDQQSLAISEILYNLPQLPLSTAVQKLLSKRKRVIAKIGNKKTKIRTRKLLIRKHMNQILSTILAVKKELTELI
jgi:hypothetical protein